ncbi:Efflux pump [Lachnellula subtilissima]|uniref:Efflux pump n=1 Tax=Lachnellula subtilissima TaxID=602034 RepID=A0A8H8RS89_9HELO|nr:Efflux pump [Lachnellula subtilissima]
MATILYKKFLKKYSSQQTSPSQTPPCNHQIDTSNASDIPLAEPHTRREKNIPRTIDRSFVSDGDDACEVCRYQKKALRKYRWKVIVGLSCPFLVQALDSTIIAGALPYIASDFHQLSQLNWIISAFNLTSATFIPLWAQYADVFGRYTAIQTALLFMLLGSILCSAAPVTSFAMLLVGRAFQGLGCSGLLIITKIILADKVSLKENARNNTTFTIVAGIGYGVGPVIGGYLTQASWRWCFIINVPLGILGLALAHFVLRPELLGPQKVTRTNGPTDVEVSQTFRAKVATIDFVGQFLFLFGIGLLVLSLTWAGSSFPWSDVKVLTPLIVGCVLTVAFIAWEYLMLPGSTLSLSFPTQKAMIPFNLVCSRNAGVLMYINFVTGMAMYAVFYFVGLYFALVKQFESGKSGGAYIAMFACNKFPLQTFFPLILGTFIEPLGITLLALALNSNNQSTIYGMLALTGIGTGLRFMPGTLHGIAYFPAQIASIISMTYLSTSLGGIIATTLMLNILNNTLRASGISFSGSADSASSFDAIVGMDPQQQAFLREKAKRGIVLAFYALSAFCWLGVLACLALGNVQIGKNGKEDTVCKGSYIGTVLWKRDVVRETVEEGKSESVEHGSRILEM